jgi:hypothetical protein
VEWVRRRWYVAVGLAAGLTFFAWLTIGAVQQGNERRQSRERIEALAEQIAVVVTQLNNATGQEARDRSSATLAVAIAEIRRSIDCVALYVNGERPPACTEVALRMDAVRAGTDPFTRQP